MSRPDLLLLHGALGASSQFKALIPLLREKYDVHTLEFEGHGSSPPKNRPFRTKHFAENVLEYMKMNAVKAADIFGHSMGGAVGLYLARFYPKRIKRVFTLGTKFVWTPKIAKKENVFLNPKKLLEKVPKYAIQLQQRHTASGLEKILEMVREMNVSLAKESALLNEDFEKINKKVRIGVGDRDVLVSIEESVNVYRLLQHGELQIFPDTPHPLERISVPSLANSIVNFFK